MSDVVSDVLRKAFSKEESAVVGWLQRRKIIAGLILLVAIEIGAYIAWPQQSAALVGYLVSTYREWLPFVLLIWIASLTVSLWHRDHTSTERVYIEDFQRGLDRWEYAGEWRTPSEGRRNYLVVTNSDAGGIARPCLLWSDYIFEFDTKIVLSNSAWLVRASDIFNYMMLQCGQEVITPHIRTRGIWLMLEPIKLPLKLPLNEWFSVRVRVSGVRVEVKITVDGKEMTVLDRPLLEPKSFVAQITDGKTITQTIPMTVSFPLGSVGFRECDTRECAYFRNVRVTKI